MLLMRGRTFLVLLAGLLSGGFAGYGVKASRGSAVAQEAEVPEMDMAQFALTGTMDAGVALARQLEKMQTFRVDFSCNIFSD